MAMIPRSIGILVESQESERILVDNGLEPAPPASRINENPFSSYFSDLHWGLFLP
jgi:hypothetical protein